MLFSILIPTLESRKATFQKLHAELSHQIHSQNLSQDVEVIHLCDAGELSIGAKRNALLDQASGDFLAFVDDDDLVSPDYVSRICHAIGLDPSVDCIGIRAIITFRGARPSPMSYSVHNRDISSRGHEYFRPPFHWNPIRRTIATRYRFPDVSYSEDFHWALLMRDDGVLRRETPIDSPIYFYLSRRWWPYQFALDITEGLRHSFGLTMVNRLRLKRPQ